MENYKVEIKGCYSNYKLDEAKLDEYMKDKWYSPSFSAETYSKVVSKAKANLKNQLRKMDEFSGFCAWVPCKLCAKANFLARLIENGILVKKPEPEVEPKSQ